MSSQVLQQDNDQGELTPARDKNSPQQRKLLLPFLITLRFSTKGQARLDYFFSNNTLILNR